MRVGGGEHPEQREREVQGPWAGGVAGMHEELQGPVLLER